MFFPAINHPGRFLPGFVPCLRTALGAVLGVMLGGTATANERIAAAPPGMVEAGAPAFVVFGPESLGLRSAPTDLKQLPDGRMLIVAQRDLAIGDGVRWELLRQAEGDDNFILQNVALDAAGRIYAGVRDGFSRVDFGTDGQWRFTRVAGMPAGDKQPWPELQNAEKVAGQWYWYAGSGGIAQWDLRTEPHLIGRMQSTERIFAVGERIFLSDFTDGALYRLDLTGLTCIIPAQATDLTNIITSSAPYAENLVLVGTNAAGVRLFDGISSRRLVERGLLAGGYRINDLCPTLRGFYAAAVDTVGIVFFDRSGRIVQVLDKSMDHRLARPQRLCYAPDGVLWVTLNEGVARIEFPSRISHFEAMLGTALNYVEPIRHEGRLWLLANSRALRGVYSDDQRLVQLVDDSPPGKVIFKLMIVAGRLLAASEGQIYERTPAGWQLLASDLPNARILPDSPFPDRWVYVARNELGWIYLRENPVRLQRQPAPELGDCFGAVQDQAGILWLELGTGRVARLNPRQELLRPEVLDARHGLPDSWAALYLLDGHLQLNSANHVMRFDETTHRFVDDMDLLRRYPLFGNCTGRPLRDRFGRIWMNGTDRLRLIEDTPTGSRFAQERLPADFRPYNFIDDERGVVWMHDKRHLTRFDPEMPLPEPAPLRALFTRIDLPGSNRSLFAPGATLPELEYADNALVAHFVAPGNPFGRHVTFEILLEGLGDKWVSTGLTGSAVFNNLKPGRYLLRVRPQIDGQPGEEAQLRITIAPPWFRTSWAYASYTLLLLLGLSAAIFLPIYSERRQKARLEHLVFARTVELNEANHRLAQQVRETLQKASALQASEERYRRLSQELEQRVAARTDELQQRVAQVETLNLDLHASQEAMDRSTAQLQEANASLRTANHELEAFSYSVSHDLRAPLRNITGFIELLQKRVQGHGDRESDRFLDIVVAESKRMSALIDDLLAFSRIGRAELKWQPVHLETLIAQVQQELASELTGRHLEWHLLPLPPVQGDPTLLRQVISNLLGNAVKFTRRRDPARIEIGCQPGPEADGLLCFYVRDNGEGFNPKYVDKLFRVFQRLHSTRDFEGTGIGLANVKRIITRHGGSVQATGTPGAGACFTFTLRPAQP